MTSALILFRIRKFLAYKLAARGAHALHSPFLFDLYNQVIRQSGSERIASIEQLRKRLKYDDTILEVIDFKSGQTAKKTVGAICKTSSSTPKFSSFLRLLADYLGAKTLLETGTSLGLNTLYLAESDANTVISIEGSQVISLLAKKHLSQLKKAFIVNGDLYEVLEREIVRHKPDFYFLDADHRSSAIAFCIDLILKHTPTTKCIVIHDIYWSPEMSEMWESLKEDPRFSLTFDIFQAGILFPNVEMEKQHFILRF
ncbi:MAG: class I SAM-dependent methyltransferase [Ekhidna sp.]